MEQNEMVDRWAECADNRSLTGPPDDITLPEGPASGSSWKKWLRWRASLPLKSLGLASDGGLGLHAVAGARSSPMLPMTMVRAPTRDTGTGCCNC